MRAIILAGGKGTRLSPYTSVFPKPLMPIDGVPILHVVVCQLKECGFHHITFAVGHMAEMIKTYFRHGKNFGVEIDYSWEEKPLGTIGALSLIEDLPENFLVMNGDILTDLDFKKFYFYHVEQGACATIACYSKKVKIEYGTVEFNKYNEIIGFQEKPTLDCQVSMGVYAFNSRILPCIKKDCYLDFPDLVSVLLKGSEKTIRFPFNGYWVDIGCHADYEKAAGDFEKMRHQFIKEPTPTLHEMAVG
jgi:NDP-sugar pyrophosphorylase family protein